MWQASKELKIKQQQQQQIHSVTYFLQEATSSNPPAKRDTNWQPTIIHMPGTMGEISHSNHHKTINPLLLWESQVLTRKSKMQF